MEGYISDNEQVEVIRKWWRENGKSLVLGLIIGLVGLFIYGAATNKSYGWNWIVCTYFSCNGSKSAFQNC